MSVTRIENRESQSFIAPRSSLSCAIRCYLCIGLVLGLTGFAAAVPCTVPDNGTGTVDLPPQGCDYISPQEVHMIIDGLPPGTTIELDPIHWQFFCNNPLPICSVPIAPGECEAPGGLLGGDLDCFESYLDLDLTGTGLLAGFSRHLSVPVACEVHTGPRNPGDPVQTFPNEMYRLQGQIFGDADFDFLSITAGTDFGLPSPGQTTLTDLGGGLYNVDSFFDVTYQIDFVGAPGSILDGMAGTTMATLHMQTGEPAPADEACCLSDGTCQDLPPADCTGTPQGEGSVCLGMEACCLPNGTCTMADALCCINEMGGTPQGLSSVCTAPEACCFSDNTCRMLDPLCCDDEGGTPQGSGSTCDGMEACCNAATGECYMADRTCCLANGDTPMGADATCSGSGSGYTLSYYGTPYYQWETPNDYGDTAFAQRFTVAVPGQLRSVDVQVYAGVCTFGDNDIDIIVYDDDGAGLPGSELGRVTLAAGSYNAYPAVTTVDFSALGLVVTSDFHVAFAPIATYPACENCISDDGSNPLGRSSVLTATGWNTMLNDWGFDPNFMIEATVDCSPPVCEPTADGTACNPPFTCPAAGEDCQARCINFDPNTGANSIIECECRNTGDCHAVPPPPSDPCIVADNGTGTVTLPPIGCDYIGPNEVHEIIDGLPPGTTIELDPIHMDFICSGSGINPVCTFALPPDECETPGGSLGGQADCFESTLDLTVTGTGSLEGFNRHLAVPVACEVHTAPRNPGDPVQAFNTVMYRMQGELFGDPDFCTLRVTGGSDYGLPSPGQTVVTELGGGLYRVDSFFDVTYQIEFEGCPGSQLADYMGTTTATIRMSTRTADPPTCAANCPLGYVCEQTVTDNPDGTSDYCCDCVPAPCEPTPDGSQCQPAQECTDISQTCEAHCMRVDLNTDARTITGCDCDNAGDCHVEPPPSGQDNPCLAPDNGSGTVNLPPQECDYISPQEVHLIIDGLPPGTTIELDPIHQDFININATPGGSLGGEIETFDSTLDLTVTGTGDLDGFSRHLAVSIASEVHTAPRYPGGPVQTFATDMFRLQGELFGDPDFCTLRITGGTDFSLPSPGQTTLTDLGDGLYHIDSFFDVTYQIEFEGCPGSQLDGYMGTTTATIRMETGTELPTCTGGCDSGFVCHRTVTGDGTGNVDVCCDCAEDLCFLTPESLKCSGLGCSVSGEECRERCLNYDPTTGASQISECDCRDPADCHIVETPPPTDPCVVDDNGTGTATLPPIGCDYIGPNEVHEIIDGLPPGTTIELDPIHMDFICSGVASNPICSLALVPGTCEMSGGSLGGQGDCFESTLDLTVTGTGSLQGFNRHLAVPVYTEVHTAPRNPGDPVQTFATDIYRLQGELFGDPDFCTLRVTGGSDYGLPGPGETTLRLRGDGRFLVDSFFDVTYQIEFEGCPGSPLSDYMGTTTATIRMETIAPDPPTCESDCPLGFVCDRSETPQPDGTVDVCCDCVTAPCEPVPDGSACQPTTECTDISQACQARCMLVDTLNNATSITDCDCRDNGDCHIEPPAAGQDNPCLVADNGTGTITLPPQGCDYLSPQEVHMIIDGLPAGTTIELDPIHNDFLNVQTTPGGSLGGEIETFDSTLRLTVTGTGSLAGFSRTLWVPVASEVHTGPRDPGEPVQTFPNEMYRLQGQLFGDPDFCTLIVTGGTDFGLPSSGQTTLTDLGDGTFHVDSFFDITYQIEFEGCPGSQLADYRGTTTATIRMETGTELPTCTGNCPVGFVCHQTFTGHGDGTFDSCCDCVPDVCAPRADGSGCTTLGCPAVTDECEKKCIRTDLATGTSTVVECECRTPGDCHVEPPPTQPDPCVRPDNGTGTITLPPIGCEYIGPNEVHEIIDGLPPGTTIELDPIHMDFICNAPSLCSLNLAQGDCEADGGSLGGQGDCFESTLDLTVTGTGDLQGFNRHLAVPIATEVHTAPRNPGDPIQSFATDMYRLQGELFGDPDFCTLRVTGGTDFSLPSPGHTTLTELPSGDFAVDSFFDVTYQIEFEGCPASPLEGYMGTTTATIRMKTGLNDPICVGGCPTDFICERTETPNANGTVDVCCNCIEDIHGCCLSDGSCVDTTPADCASQTGIVQATLCSGTSEACCEQDGTCVDADLVCCDDLGGTLQGGGLVCTATEGCCLPDGTCADLDPLCCDDEGGTPQGATTSCTAPEACCLPDQTCSMLDPLCCDEQGGVAQGSGSVCGGMEACCLPDDTCTMADALCCQNELGGTPMGPGSACTAPVACCLDDGTCADMDPICCAAQSGAPRGPGSACLGDSDGNTVDDACELVKWEQWFDPGLPGLDAHEDPPSGVLILADQWICPSGPVTDFHWWGAYEGQGSGLAGFHLSIHENIPADPPAQPWCLPGPELWSADIDVGQFIEVPTGLTNSLGEPIFAYHYFLAPPFAQLEGETYWLDISARSNDPSDPVIWRWLEAQRDPQPIVCPAVWTLNGVDWTVIEWSGPSYSDMAFVVTSTNLMTKPLPEDSFNQPCQSDQECEGVSVCLEGRCYKPKNRYISCEPNNPSQAFRIQVTLSASIPHPGLVGSSWWVQAPIVPVSGAYPKPLVGPGECIALLGPPATAAEIDWAAAGCQTLHITGCPIEPTSAYDVQCVSIDDTSLPQTLPTIPLPASGKWWGDTVGIFNGTRWTAPQGVTNIDDALVAIKTWQGGQVVPPGPVPPGNVAHLSIPDVDPADINTVVNFNDVFMLVQAFIGNPYPWGPANADGNCP